MTIINSDHEAAIAAFHRAAARAGTGGDGRYARAVTFLEPSVRRELEAHGGVTLNCSVHVTTAPGVDLAALRARVVSAIERITSGSALMRVPADLTDPDLVLADVLTLLDGLSPQINASAYGGGELKRAEG